MQLLKYEQLDPYFWTAVATFGAAFILVLVGFASSATTIALILATIFLVAAAVFMGVYLFVNTGPTKGSAGSINK